MDAEILVCRGDGFKRVTVRGRLIRLKCAPGETFLLHRPLLISGGQAKRYWCISDPRTGWGMGPMRETVFEVYGHANRIAFDLGVVGLADVRAWVLRLIPGAGTSGTGQEASGSEGEN